MKKVESLFVNKNVDHFLNYFSCLIFYCVIISKFKVTQTDIKGTNTLKMTALLAIQMQF